MDGHLNETSMGKRTRARLGLALAIEGHSAQLQDDPHDCSAEAQRNTLVSDNFAAADKNHDGFLSKNEFVAAFGKK